MKMNDRENELIGKTINVFRMFLVNESKRFPDYYPNGFTVDELMKYSGHWPRISSITKEEMEAICDIIWRAGSILSKDFGCSPVRYQLQDNFIRIVPMETRDFNG